MAFSFGSPHKPTNTVEFLYFQRQFLILHSPAPVRHFALQILDSAIRKGYALSIISFSLTPHSFYNDVSAFQQTKVVLMGLLDPDPINQQYFTLHDEPQCIFHHFPSSV